MKDSKKKVPKSNSWIFLLLICITTCFMGIGFASINIQLGITGEALAEAQTELFITDVRYVSDVNADLNNSKILTSYQTLLSSNIALSQTNNNSSITYEIDIYNSTDTDYRFKETTYMLGTDTYDNENITFTLDGINTSSVVKSKDSITFRITFKYKVNLLAANNKLKSYINFAFEPNIILASAGTLKSDSTNGVYLGSYSKSDVEKIYFVDHENYPANATVWVASVEGNYAITGWAKDNDGNGKKEVYIGANNGRISLPENCSNMFYNWSSLKVADFANVDTSKVTNMSNMFYFSMALEEINVTSFDISNLTTMKYMFYQCGNIKVFDFSSFDFSNAPDHYGAMLSTKPQLIRYDNASFSSYSYINGLVYHNTGDMTVVFKNEEEKNDFLDKNAGAVGAKTEFLTVDEYNAKYPNGKEIQ